MKVGFYLATYRGVSCAYRRRTPGATAFEGAAVGGAALGVLFALPAALMARRPLRVVPSAAVVSLAACALETARQRYGYTDDF